MTAVCDGAKTDVLNPSDLQRLQAAKLESMTTMAAGIAHDFNNHLAAILGNNAVVQRAAKDLPRAQECMHRIEAASNLALQLSDQLAVYSARVDCNPVQLDPDRLLLDVCKSVQSILPRGVKLERDVRPAPVAPSADRDLLHRALVNLATNSAEALLDMTGTITLAFGPYVPAPADANEAFFPEFVRGTCLQFSVTDTGRGMDAGVRERMFDPFFSTKIRGRGMGLPEALGIARLHKGNVLVRSVEGAGTTVRLILPSA